MGRVKEGRGLFLANAGEHYVVAELLRRDIIAALAPRNAPGIDVLATTGPFSVNVRVKTKSDDADSWVWIADKTTGSIFKRPQRERDFTVLVHFPASGQPQCWIVPTTRLDEKLRRLHDEWSAQTSRTGKPRNPSIRMRRMGDKLDHRSWLEPYKENWQLIVTALSPQGLSDNRHE